MEYNPWVETRVVANYNVIGSTSPTNIMYNTNGFCSIEIDGVVQPSVVSAYTFSTTGEHTVKYTLANPTSIGNNAFSSCDRLKNIDIPNGVTSIGNNAFTNCSRLKNIDIPNGVTTIGSGAFQTCTGLTSCTIGSGVTSIGTQAFIGCNSLTSITIEATTPPTLGVNAFFSTNDCPIYVPSESVDAYKAATNWRSYADRIQAKP